MGIEFVDIVSSYTYLALILIVVQKNQINFHQTIYISSYICYSKQNFFIKNHNVVGKNNNN